MLNRKCHAALSGFVFMLGGAAAHAQVTILEGFEGTEGRFNNPPSFSGTTAGEVDPTGSANDPSTADLDTTTAFEGTGSQRIFIDDDPAVAVAEGAWRLRHLAGGGSPNTTTNQPFAGDGYVGYYLKTATPNLQASIFIDDIVAPNSTGTLTSTGGIEQGALLPVIADNAWHLYQWNLDDPEVWSQGLSTAASDGDIDGPNVSIDGLFLISTLDSNIPDQDAIFFLDNVSHNPTGTIAVPEPASASLLAIAAAALLSRRRRNNVLS